MITPGTETWLTTHEAAQRLGVTLHHIYSLIAKRRLVAKRISSRCWLVTRESVERYKPTRNGHPRRGMPRK